MDGMDTLAERKSILSMPSMKSIFAPRGCGGRGGFQGLERGRATFPKAWKKTGFGFPILGNGAPKPGRAAAGAALGARAPGFCCAGAERGSLDAGLCASSLRWDG